ncbi:MAG TPA: hypothetical protein VMT24_17945 [Aggregatilineaceae bacterium]|nr:hypothetical protein [Aggregatilineaceae bacterium]
MKLVFQGAPVAVVSVELVECDDSACASGKPQQVGPQRIACDVTRCTSRAYGYSTYQKLIITFADRTRASNVFTKRAFYASYTITVTDTALQVEEDMLAAFGNFALVGGTQGNVFLPSVLLTIIVETLVAGAYLLISHQPRRVLLWVPVVNLITVPVVWLLVRSPVLTDSTGFKLLGAEVGAVLIEALLLRLFSRNALSLRHALTVSVLMNVMSFMAGYLLAFVGL